MKTSSQSAYPPATELSIATNFPSSLFLHNRLAVAGYRRRVSKVSTHGAEEL
ncbi:hypothetical protein HPP92_010922 [Vanilla planifolia]|uniref:Uncharacterized protein n=1 Tax=Vanilla planifolia TaxID=51239 RepID=A0A835QWL7_VANPL|nr:hypothetical protein HPP92_010922 [Vanilla planifolia]